MGSLSMAPLGVKLPSRPQSAKSPSRPQSARVRPQSAQSRRSEGDGGPGGMLSYKGLMTRQQHQNRPTSAGRRILPAELGLSGRRVLTLPSHVDNCDQGESCCWCWLAHAVLKEASWLKEDLDTLRKEHAERLEHQAKVEHSTEELAELRGAHRTLQSELRTSRDQCDTLRQELLLVKTQVAQKLSREEDLLQDVARLKEEKSEASSKAEHAMQRQMEIERENFKMHADAEDLKRQLLFMEDDKARSEGLLKALKKECEVSVCGEDEKMEMKLCIALFILGLVSTVLAKGGHHSRGDKDRHRKGKGEEHPKCPEPITSNKLPFQCTVSGKCDTFSCHREILGKTVKVVLMIDRSKEPLSAEIKVYVLSPKFDWSHTFQSGDKYEVEGSPVKGMFVSLTMEKTAKGIAFKLDLSVDGIELDEPVLQGKLPMGGDYDDEGHHDGHKGHHKGRCSRAYAWFKRQSGAVKAAVVISAILGLSLLISGMVYCCKKRRAAPIGALKVKPPSYDEATSEVKSKVPMEPLVNEE